MLRTSGTDALQIAHHLRLGARDLAGIDPLTLSDVLAEINSPRSTANGASNMWYMNLNPTPSDISDKSGNGHNPAWVGGERPRLWSGQ